MEINLKELVELKHKDVISSIQRVVEETKGNITKDMVVDAVDATKSVVNVVEDKYLKMLISKDFIRPTEEEWEAISDIVVKSFEWQIGLNL